MPVLLISRGTMSGVALLVEQLSACTGFDCVSRENLVALVNRHGELAQRIVERLGNPARSYEQLCELRRPYVILMRAALLEYASRDNLIYHGYSGHLLLPSMPHFVRIRINAPLALRVEMTMRRLQCSEEEAKTHITQDDEARVRWARFMYGTDIRDPSLYDVCINLERMSIQTACNVLCALKEDAECQATPDQAAMVERMLLAARIESALATDARTAAMELGAQVEDGRVTVTGSYVDDARRDAVLEIARGVAGAGEVEYRYGFAPTFGART
jgi:cytidylate kinase